MGHLYLIVHGYYLYNIYNLIFLGRVDNCARMSEKALFFEYRNAAYLEYVSNETQKNDAFSPSSCNCQHALIRNIDSVKCAIISA
jgi:hypothetical protein